MLKHSLRIFKSLKASTLTLEEQKKLLGLLSFIADVKLEVIADIFEKKPEWIPEYYELTMRKAKAMQEKDFEELKALTLEEQKQITHAV